MWDESYKDYHYTQQPVTDAEIELWKSQGYTHDTVTGKMYSSRNPMPNWVEAISSILSLTNCGYTFYRMDTLDIMPMHSDSYTTYCELFGVEYKDVLRAVVFLEDWKYGHSFELGGKSHTNWKAGQSIVWSADEAHSAANIGIEPRYTLQITGTNI